MMGGLSMGGNKISTVLYPTAAQDVSSKIYADTLNTLKVSKSGETMSGSIDMNLNNITNIADPLNAQDITTKNYLDAADGGIAKYWVVFGNQFPAIDNVTIAVCSLPAG